MERRLILLLILFPFVFTQAQIRPVPLDPQLMYGRLENGLTYYIRQNKQPEQRAEFYLVQRTGSLQEEEHQRGLSHLLEHMAFNGTTHFPGNGIDDYLEKIGLKGGDDQNAYTAFDETVYMITGVPTSRTGTIDSCLLILRDISANLLLNDTDIEKERAVIREEWRSGRDASSRITEQQLPVLLGGSKYAERLPIGRIEVIENFKPEDLRSYYRKWYRPDLQAVVVVGDFNPDAVKGKIAEFFGEIPKPDSPIDRGEAPVPDNEKPTITIVKDQEAAGYIVNLYYKHDIMPDSIYESIEGLRKDYLQTVTSTLLNERLDQLLYLANPPFVFAQTSDGAYMNTQTKEAWNVSAIAEEGKIDSTLFVLAREVERINRFGFTLSEYERIKVTVLKYYESMYLERESEVSSTYSSSYITHFTQGGYLPGIELEFDLINQLAEETGIDEVNQHAQAILGNTNVVIAISGPEKDAPGVYPKEEELLDLFQRVSTIELEPYKEEENLGPLLAVRPAPGKIVHNTKDSLFDATVLTLSNGVRVVAKKTTFREDEIVVVGSSPGGSTLFGKEDKTNLKVLSEVPYLGGLGQHSSIDLNRMLAGKNLSCSITINENSEGIGGYTSVSDMRTFFELLYLYFTDVRADEAAYSSYVTRLGAQLKNYDLSPMVAFSDSLIAALYGDVPEMKRINETDLQNLNYQRIMEMHKERFADASDFTFTVVGNFNEDSLRLFAKEYLAVLPAIHRQESGKEEEVLPYRTGKIQNHFTKPMETPKTSVVHYFHGKDEYTLQNYLNASFLTQLLDLIYMEKVRKDEGGSYGVTSQAQINPFPKGRLTLQIYYDTDPERQVQINSIVLTELSRLGEEGPRKEDFDKVKENLLKTYEENLTGNIYWLSILDNYYFDQFNGHSSFLQTLDGITPETVRDFTKHLLNQNNHVEVIMSPELNK